MMRQKTVSSRALVSALFALLLLAQCAVFPPRAEAKKTAELAVEPGSYVRWRRGLPPQDGQWHRVMIIAPGGLFSSYVLRGNNEQASGGSNITGLSDGYAIDSNVLAMVSDLSGGSQSVIDARLDAEAEIDSFPSIDVGKEVFYTSDYMNTPLMRYESTAGPNRNGRNRFYGNAPYYSIRLSDWSQGDGVPQEQYLTYAPDELRNASGDPLYAFRVTPKATPWYFCGYEHESSVDRNKYVIGNLQTETNSGTNIYMEMVWVRNNAARLGNSSTGASFPSLLARKNFWINTMEFYIYYGDRVNVTALRDGQSIENGQSMTLGKSGFLTLAAGSTLTIRDGGILCVDGTFFNDGTIRVEKGGTLIVRKNACVMPWDTNSGTGNIVCEGGDVIVYSGARVVCNGSSGFRAANSTVHNFGAILTQSLDVKGLKNCFHNDGAVMVGYNVQSERAQSFRDAALTIDASGTPSSGVMDCVKALKHKCYSVGDGCATGHPIHVC